MRSKNIFLWIIQIVLLFFGSLILFLNFLGNLLNAFVHWYINVFVYKFNETFTKNYSLSIYINLIIFILR